MKEQDTSPKEGGKMKDKEIMLFTMTENKKIAKRLYINVIAVARAANIHVVRNSLVHELSEQEDGRALTDGYDWVIVYDDTQPIDVSRSTIARLIGRIFLGADTVASPRERYNTKRKNNFKDLLKSKGVTQMVLAEHLGVDQTLVSQWCNGKTRMNVESAVRVAKFLGCDLDEVAASLIELREKEV